MAEALCRPFSLISDWHNVTVVDGGPHQEIVRANGSAWFPEADAPDFELYCWTWKLHKHSQRQSITRNGVPEHEL